MNKAVLMVLAVIATATAVSTNASSEPGISVSVPVNREWSPTSPRVPGVTPIEAIYRSYQLQLQSAIFDVLSSLTPNPGETCTLKIFQSRLAKVLKVELVQCGFTPELQDEVRSRLMGVQLPYAHFQPLISRQLLATICAGAGPCEGAENSRVKY